MGAGKDDAELVLERLYGLQEVGAGLKELLAQRALRSGALEVFEALTCCVLKALPGKLEIHLSILEQLSLECPRAFHKQLQSFVDWLKSEDLVFSVAACKILSQVLPSWEASKRERQKMSEKLVEEFTSLLDESTSPSKDLGQLARAVVQCLAVVIEYLAPSRRDLLLGHFGHTVRCLSEGLQGGVSDARLCRFTWILGSLLEFLDQSSMEQLGETVCPGLQGVQAVCQAAVRLLAECCLNGPAAAKPAMMPALGFALRRHPELLEMEHLSPLEVLKQGLKAGASLRQQAAETLATLAAADEGTAQKLASLQQELLSCLEDPKAAPPALRAFRCLCDQGVVHPGSALASIIAVTFSDQLLTGHARPLLLRLVEAGPPLLAQRCGTALRSAAVRLEGQRVYGDAWRYAALLEAYGEVLDSKQLRDQFLSCLLSEALLSEASVTHLELLAGLLARLVSREAELMRIFHSLVQFLTLKLAPLEELPCDSSPAVLVLHELCVQWWQQLPPELAKLMRSTWGKAVVLPTDDQALPTSFSRQLPDLASLFEP